VELHGTDSAISLERRRKEMVIVAVAVYEDTIGMVSHTEDNTVLHHSWIDDILKWT
jgi:uncharacterized protein YegJ (DUF2314 family)